SDGVASGVEDVLLAALQIRVARGQLAELRLPESSALIADEHVLGLQPLPLQPQEVHRVPRGEAAKTPAVLERLWRELELGRDGTIVAYGGGATSGGGGGAPPGAPGRGRRGGGAAPVAGPGRARIRG